MSGDRLTGAKSLGRPEDQPGVAATGLNAGSLPTLGPPSFYKRYGKRLVDAAASFAGLVLLSPVWFVVGVLVKCTSPGPILFRQERIGRDGKVFRILKFRSMVVDADKKGGGITVAGDARVTRLGTLLREFKIDELPQLWNVLTGEMSLVGPRPELPQYVSNYTPEQRLVLCVRPGITDIASIRYRHEEAILAQHENPQQFYRNVVLPEKLKLNIRYIRSISLSGDITLIMQTLLSSFH